MSDLGKIRAGSPRVYRDRIFGKRGEVLVLPPRASADLDVRLVFHPEDVTEEQAVAAVGLIPDLVRECYKPLADRATVYGLRIRMIGNVPGGVRAFIVSGSDIASPPE